MRVEWKVSEHNIFDGADMMPGAIYFHSFGNKSGIKGQGAKALSQICRMADKTAVALVLNCYEPKLFPYYESFGFQSQPSQSRLSRFERNPQTQTHVETLGGNHAVPCH